MLTPHRHRGEEFLDRPEIDPAVVTRSLADVARANALFGGTHAVASEVARVLAQWPRDRATLLDVGSGFGDIAARLRRQAGRRGITLVTIGVEPSAPLAARALGAGLPMVRATVFALPFAPRSVDIVTCSQLLHHFEDEEAVRAVRELDRVARHRVIVSDLRRSWLAAAGIWLASFPLRFHPVSRHDGALSVLRGFTPRELGELVATAVRGTPHVRRHPGFRTTAAWRPVGVRWLP